MVHHTLLSLLSCPRWNCLYSGFVLTSYFYLHFRSSYNFTILLPYQQQQISRSCFPLFQGVFFMFCFSLRLKLCWVIPLDVIYCGMYSKWLYCDLYIAPVVYPPCAAVYFILLDIMPKHLKSGAPTKTYSLQYAFPSRFSRIYPLISVIQPRMVISYPGNRINSSSEVSFAQILNYRRLFSYAVQVPPVSVECQALHTIGLISEGWPVSRVLIQNLLNLVDYIISDNFISFQWFLYPT